MKWYIGQRVIAITTISGTHGSVGITKGTIYEIQSIRKSPCCGKIEIDVGVSSLGKYTGCGSCSGGYKSNGTWYFLEHRFAPLDELSDYTSDELINEIEKELVKV